MSAPIAAYSINGMQVTGASGGGSATLSIVMDNRYTSLVQYVTWSNDQVASADADFRTRISAGGNVVPVMVDSGVVSAISATVSTATVSRTWNPTPIILPGGTFAPFIEHKMLNVENDEYFLATLIYLFDIRVRELMPMGPLLFARGAT